ncbi:MAG: phosphatase PAP2 family protein [Methyloceanibacter sp.]
MPSAIFWHQFLLWCYLGWLPSEVLTVAVVLTLLVGFTRVYLGIHWPTDVLAGWCIEGRMGAGLLAHCHLARISRNN